MLGGLDQCRRRCAVRMRHAALKPLRAVAAVCLMSVLAACGAEPEAEPDTFVSIAFFAASDLNPDIDSRPSPAVVRVFELTSADAFRTVTYFDLRDDAEESLGATFLSEQELILNPGLSQERRFGVSNDARAIGVAVDYQDIENAVWRGYISIRTGEENQLRATLTADEVILTLFRPL